MSLPPSALEQVERDLAAILDGLMTVLRAIETHNMAITELAHQLGKLNRHIEERLKRLQVPRVGKQPS